MVVLVILGCIAVWWVGGEGAGYMALFVAVAAFVDGYLYGRRQRELPP
jgi:hypothetical protein